jgi:undecaprenyl-phosphate 4-deoxy-4-formamido-L-arabinose transferase
MPENPAVDVSVLVPLYNEVDGADRCHREICTALEPSGHSFEVVFVDDGSTDGSADRLREIAKHDSRVTFVKLLYNIGQQRAMYAALRYCRGRAVITYDADLQFRPECLPALAKKVFEGYDIVGGVREQRRDSLFANRLPSWIGRQLINSALRIRQRDFGAVKAYSSRVVQMLLAMNAPLVVIPAMAYSISRNTTEIPVRHQPRETGVSKWSILARVETYLDIYTLYARRPFAWMLVSGVASLLLSLLLGMGILLYRLFVSSNFSGLIIFFDVFLFATGIYFFSLSLIGEFVVRNLRGNRFDSQQVVEEVVRGAR